MTKVYAVIDEDDERKTLGIFSTREKAEAFIGETAALDIEEIDVDFREGEVCQPLYYLTIDFATGDIEDYGHTTFDVVPKGQPLFARTTVSTVRNRAEVSTCDREHGRKLLIEARDKCLKKQAEEQRQANALKQKWEQYRKSPNYLTFFNP